MREGIHPKYYPEAKIVCSCGNTWNTGSTRAEIHTDVCYKCHPFFTGEQRIVDTEGQVDRFYKKLEARNQYQAAVTARSVSKTSTDQAVGVLGLGERIEGALTKAGLTTITLVLERLTTGDDAMLAVDGLGRKGLIDLKKRLRARGYLPDEAGEAETSAA